MRNLVFAVCLAIIPSLAHAETQAVAKARTMKIMTDYMHVPSGAASYTWTQFTYPLQYATAVELLAATPTEGAIGYAIDTNTFYLNQGGTWAVWSAVITPTVYALAATLLATTPADGTVAYAQDTDLYYLRSNSTWTTTLGQYALTLGNGASISNATDGAIIFGEASEDLALTFTSNLATFSSSTAATVAFTPATAFTGDVTLNGGAGALTFGAGSSSVVIPDNSATGLDVGSTGLTNALRVSTLDNAEAVTFNAGQINAVVNITDTATLDASDCGKTMLVTAGIDTKSITLPAVISGCTYTFVYVGADDGALVDISPNAADGIFGTCTLAASIVTFSGTDDADIGLTKTGGNKGDMIQLTGGTDWYVTGCSGIWANN